MVRLTCNGVRWQMEGAEDEVLRREVFERIDELGELSEARRLKDKKRRMVYEVGLSDGRRMIVKLFRAGSWQYRIKERLLRNTAAAEWAAARRLKTLGVPASRAVALGHAVGRGEQVHSYLVIEAAGDVLGANWFLKTLGPPDDPGAAERALRFTRELARFVRRVHDAGVRHDDLHAGNVFVRRDAASEDDRFVLIDLQRTRIGRPPGARHRTRAIAQLLSTFTGANEMTPVVRATFLEAYLAAGRPFSSRYTRLERVLALIERQRATRLASRGRRCVRNSTDFAVEKVQGWRIYHRRDYAVAELLALVEHHGGAPGAGGGPAGEPAGVSRVRRDEGGTVLEVRRFPPPPGLRRILHVVVPCPGVREYAAAHRQRLRTRAGPLAVAAMVRLRGEERGMSVCILGTQPPESSDRE